MSEPGNQLNHSQKTNNYENLTIFEKSLNCPSNNQRIPLKSNTPMDEKSISELIPAQFLESEDLDRDFSCIDELILPEVSENELVRHYIRLSRKNYGVDTGFYPLGSCTMKFNPKLNEYTARLQGFQYSHPLQPIDTVQGNLKLMYELERDLSELAGMDAFTLQPAAGAHGEYTGISIIKKYFSDKGEKKKFIVIPDSAHGTNPATSAMCGFGVISIKSNEFGEVDLEQLEKAMEEGDVAGIMLTNPNTLGLFDRNILKITEIVHKHSGLCYYDGANMNAMMGKCKPGDMGFDVVHLNLHKTFSTPHGGGGPGSGPVGVKKFLEHLLPIPRIKKNIVDNDNNITYTLDFDNPDSIGRIRSYYGNFGILVRAYTYIKLLGKDGLKRASENAVLNANYIRTQLKDDYFLPYDRICQHECVFSDRGIPNEVTTLDIAKRLLDYGMHAPTIYFPLIVHGAIMIEPTETETKATLDKFVAVMKLIKEEAEKNPEKIKKAPHSTPIGRLDETLAARKPVLKYSFLKK